MMQSPFFWLVLLAVDLVISMDRYHSARYTLLLCLLCLIVSRRNSTLLRKIKAYDIFFFGYSVLK